MNLVKLEAIICETDLLELLSLLSIYPTVNCLAKSAIVVPIFEPLRKPVPQRELLLGHVTQLFLFRLLVKIRRKWRNINALPLCTFSILFSGCRSGR